MAEAFPALLIISFLAIWLWRAATLPGDQFVETLWIWVWVVVPIFGVIAFIRGI